MVQETLLQAHRTFDGFLIAATLVWLSLLDRLPAATFQSWSGDRQAGGDLSQGLSGASGYHGLSLMIDTEGHTVKPGARTLSDDVLQDVDFFLWGAPKRYRPAFAARA